MKRKHKRREQKQQNSKPDHDIERMKPLIVINESDECLFAIVDFSIPGRNHVRRIISKRVKSTGKITAVMYEGEVGPDNTCSQKFNIMEMKEAPPDKFWSAINVLRDLYGIVGGISDVRCYDGKSLKEATDLMCRFDHAQVWVETVGKNNRQSGA
ncbi:MAG: hypothetical protein WCS96_00555 [Victivallales bacterium]